MPCMYMQQPGGWAEQSELVPSSALAPSSPQSATSKLINPHLSVIGMGYGQRSNRS